MNYVGKMRAVLRTLLLIMVGVVPLRLAAITATELKQNYQGIVDRNPFGLRPPPPPATNPPPAVKEKPKSELYLTGIVSIGFPKVPKKAYLMTREAAGKKEAAYYDLTEGSEKDGIRVISIDEIGRKVKVHTEDEGDLELTFESHGVPPPVGAPAGKPLLPGQPGFNPGQPGVQPPGVVPPQPVANAQPPTTYPVGTTPTYSNSTTPVRTIPSRRVRASMDNISQPGVPNLPSANPNSAGAQPEMDPAEQYIRMHLNKAAAEKQGIPMPPLPVINQ